MFQLQLFFLLHCDEWDRVVALPRHKFVTGATLLQLLRTEGLIMYYNGYILLLIVVLYGEKPQIWILKHYM